MDKQLAKKIIKGKFLVIKPSSLGDVVHSLPFLYSIKRCFPGSVVQWVIADSFAGLLEGHPLIEKLWVINKDDWKKPIRILKSLKEFRALSAGLKAEGFDMVFDLQGLLRSALIAKATGCLRRVGFAEAREGGRLFYTHRVRGGRGVHAVERYLRMAEHVGCVAEAEFPLPKLKGYNPLFKDYAAMVPGARWPSKRWSAERFGELARRLPGESVILGGRNDVGLAEEVLKAAGGRAVSLAGKSSLKELVEIIRYASLVVTNDSGPMHIAAALGVPVVAIFGPTDPALTGPYGKGVKVIVREQAECSPCRKRQCKDARCMGAITVDKVLSRIEKAL